MQKKEVRRLGEPKSAVASWWKYGDWEPEGYPWVALRTPVLLQNGPMRGSEEALRRYDVQKTALTAKYVRDLHGPHRATAFGTKMPKSPDKDQL